MKLYSKFHDYYDHGIAYGIDENCFFIREQKEIKVHNPHTKKGDIVYPILHYGIDLPRYYKKISDITKIQSIDSIKIGFCGKLYVCNRVSKVLENFPVPLNIIDFYIYNIRDLDRFVAQYASKKELALYETKFEKDKFVSGHRKFFCRDYMEREFDKIQQMSYNLDEIHHFYESPIILQNEKYQIIVNPCLKDLQFYKVVDSNRAFQEISMYISGVLGGNSPKMIEISDKDKIHKHGFDEWSFRKKGEN